MIDLPLTFIIPYKKDCDDRQRNLSVVVRYLLHNYNSNVIVLEADQEKTIDKILPEDDRLTCMFEYLPEGAVFHRTKYLNMMLDQVTTPLVANYDVDVMFDPSTIDKACCLILNNKADVVYPFGELKQDQLRLFLPSTFDENYMINRKLYEHPRLLLDGMREYFDGELPVVDNPHENLKNVQRNKNENPFFMSEHDYQPKCDFPNHGIGGWTTLAGHCIIFRTKTYFDGFMENEEFIGWGPEDAERLKRFRMLGYNVVHLEGNLVFHLEHRNPLVSTEFNPNANKNELLWRNTFDPCNTQEEYEKIYSSYDYYNKYSHKEKELA